MKFFLTVAMVLLFKGTLMAQVPAFDEIYVTHRTDSLEKLLPKQTGLAKLFHAVKYSKKYGLLGR